MLSDNIVQAFCCPMSTIYFKRSTRPKNINFLQNMVECDLSFQHFIVTYLETIILMKFFVDNTAFYLCLITQSIAQLLLLCSY